MKHKTKWLIFAPVGLLTVGTGACLINWAGELKSKGVAPTKWVSAGTAALVVFNAGLSMFGQSIIEKVLHEVREKPTE
ncbi:hypothetical protein GO988_16320 [Hymenobacter sp. HMF4947]|uniref:Uncharacterized protein n=1 Tax=Hymenobacter ginkgonis TaxID=2682976 RepID=A0A7K1THI5_9BACT|nr:hypothetical protein [Hymenobacter ginkgonis]MVN77897.1 hypothetical protein [Hymenobacter ginkgonis]